MDHDYDAQYLLFCYEFGLDKDCPKSYQMFIAYEFEDVLDFN